jgi:uncharacterized membrane protein YdjX (TVP38/TMEM64 family)
MADTAPPPSAPSRQAKPVRPSASLRLKLARAGALVFVVGISLLIYALRDQVKELGQFGYPGLFLLMVLTSATIVLPAPGLTIVLAAGSAFNPFAVGVVAGLGSTVGELTGYLAGFSGQAVIENRETYERVSNWMRRYGALTIAALAFIPLPFFDLAGIAAGALKMPMHSFLFWCAVGKVPKMLLVAYAGAYSLDWLARWIG